MQKFFRSSILAAAFTLPACGLLPAASAQSTHSSVNTNLLLAGPAAPMPPVPTVPKPSVVAALEANGPAAPMPPVPTVPKPAMSITLVMAV
jgi:hypothetical protein